jgi:hypothetical protein
LPCVRAGGVLVSMPKTVTIILHRKDQSGYCDFLAREVGDFLLNRSLRMLCADLPAFLESLGIPADRAKEMITRMEKTGSSGEGDFAIDEKREAMLRSRVGGDS